VVCFSLSLCVASADAPRYESKYKIQIKGKLDMGTAKDIIDLVTQLSDSIQDRKVAAELFKIIALANQLQVDNFNLQKEIMELKKENQEIQQKLNDKNLKTIFHADLLWLADDDKPYRPTCYDSEQKLIHMHSFERQDINNNQVYKRPGLRCPKCRHVTDIAQHP
jgi:hypothetical protein